MCCKQLWRHLDVSKTILVLTHPTPFGHHFDDILMHPMIFDRIIHVSSLDHNQTPIPTRSQPLHRTGSGETKHSPTESEVDGLSRTKIKRTPAITCIRIYFRYIAPEGGESRDPCRILKLFRCREGPKMACFGISFRPCRLSFVRFPSFRSKPPQAWPRQKSQNHVLLNQMLSMDGFRHRITDI